MEYKLYRCQICDKPVLTESVHSFIADDISSTEFVPAGPLMDDAQVAQLWPPSLTLPVEAPARARELYEEARNVMQRSPSSFVVQIARCLEAIARERDAKGRTLNDRLNWLVTNGDLPDVLGQMGHINRMFRNWGAHDAEIDVRPEDAEVVDEFFKTIVEYLYVAPAKVQKVTTLLEHRRAAR